MRKFLVAILVIFIAFGTFNQNNIVYASATENVDVASSDDDIEQQLKILDTIIEKTNSENAEENITDVEPSLFSKIIGFFKRIIQGCIDIFKKLNGTSVDQGDIAEGIEGGNELVDEIDKHTEDVEDDELGELGQILKKVFNKVNDEIDNSELLHMSPSEVKELKKTYTTLKNELIYLSDKIVDDAETNGVVRVGDLRRYQDSFNGIIRIFEMAPGVPDIDKIEFEFIEGYADDDMIELPDEEREKLTNNSIEKIKNVEDTAGEVIDYLGKSDEDVTENADTSLDDIETTENDLDYEKDYDITYMEGAETNEEVPMSNTIEEESNNENKENTVNNEVTVHSKRNDIGNLKYITYEIQNGNKEKYEYTKEK